MAQLSAHDLSFMFGLLGNIVSFIVFLAPMPTFYKIYKRKSSEGFQAIPYLVALFSAGLLLYYAYLKKNAYLIISINAFGCFTELAYIGLFLFYAPRKSKMFTGWLMVLEVGALGMVILFSYVFAQGSERVTIVGWICAAINLAVFAAPLSIMRQVIRTKSVEFMPFTLSLFLTLCAIMWFFYGFFRRDFYIALPNVLGFLFGVVQMLLYFVYKDSKRENINEKSDLEEAAKSKDIETGIKIEVEGGSDKELHSMEMAFPDCGNQNKQEDDQEMARIRSLK
ncbi:bidirectional sugar transporter sweet9 [Nicotiana attenuata]|uniref:Bidirectional sugar transporter SWEET n=1 Tax=Nicotiana attenuata TaxID=49451 RepID=A0A1J6ID24_NICAT|nr:bidirectional sugar transporter sweet9 [Nicotiana attenuata]